MSAPRFSNLDLAVSHLHGMYTNGCIRAMPLRWVRVHDGFGVTFVGGRGFMRIEFAVRPGVLFDWDRLFRLMQEEPLIRSRVQLPDVAAINQIDLRRREADGGF